MIYDKRDLTSNNPLDILDSFDYLTESYTTPDMVSIRYSNRLDQNMIQLESMVDYAVTNGIDNASFAIKEICKNNHIDENVSFCVNETSLYEDIQMLDTVVALREHQYKVNIMPISKNSIYYTTLQEALENDDDLMQYVNEGIIGNTIDRAKTRAGNVYNYAKTNLTNNVNNLKEGRTTLASKYSALKRTISEKYEEAKRATGEAKVKLLQQINKLKEAANSIKQKLSSSN